MEASTESAGGIVVGHVTQRRRLPHGRTFIGKGKVTQLKELADSVDASIIIFDHDMTPAQIRNLEEATERKIIDRSELILDIFSSRASSTEAKLQVEIAQLEYTYPRLRAMWDHLGQVTGGAPIGIGTRGPGEQQIEIDRRLVQRRQKQLRRELAEIQDRSVREVEKRNNDHFTVGLVGYTNAGKSTIFNALTAGGAWAHDQLFATLSTRVERWELGGGTGVMLSDTVGFIRRLPHHLIASFKSTLEETTHCQLLLLVLDASDPNALSQLDTVQATLDDIGRSSQRSTYVPSNADSTSPTPCKCGVHTSIRFDPFGMNCLCALCNNRSIRGDSSTNPLGNPITSATRRSSWGATIFTPPSSTPLASRTTFSSPSLAVSMNEAAAITNACIASSSNDSCQRTLTTHGFSICSRMRNLEEICIRFVVGFLLPSLFT